MKTIIGSIEIRKNTRALVIWDDEQKYDITVGNDSVGTGYRIDDEQAAREWTGTVYRGRIWDYVEVLEPIEYTNQELVYNSFF